MDDDSDIVCLSSDTDENQGSDNCDGETRRTKVTFRLDQNGSDHSSIHGDDEDNNQSDRSRKGSGSRLETESDYSENAGNGPIYESDYVGLISNVDEDDNNNTQHQEDSCQQQPDRICFNCDSTEHVLNSCPHPKNHMKVKEAFERFKLKSNSSTFNTKAKRYHQSNAKLYDSKKPGKVSNELREVLGLQPNQLPGHVYKMRENGYPPGWKSDAKITSTGLRFMDDPDDLSQPRPEVTEQENPVYDKEKIIRYPGFNDPLPQNQFLDVSQFQSRGNNQKKKRKTNEESNRYGVRPYSDDYSVENCVSRWTNDHRRAKKRSHGEMRSHSNSSTSQEEDRNSRISSASSSNADMWATTSDSSHPPHRRNPKEPRMDDFQRSDAPYPNYQPPQQYTNNNNNNNFGQSFNQGMTQAQHPNYYYNHDKYQDRNTGNFREGNPMAGNSSRSTINYENTTLPSSDPRRSSSYSGYPPPRFHNPRMMMNSGYPPPINSFNQNPLMMNVAYPPATNTFDQSSRMMHHNNNSSLSYPSVTPSNTIEPYNPPRFSHQEYFPTNSSSNSSGSGSRLNKSKNSTVQNTHTSASNSNKDNNNRSCRVRNRSPSLLEGPDIQTIDVEAPTLEIIKSYQKLQERVSQKQYQIQQQQQQKKLPEGWDTAEPKESSDILLKNPLYQPSKRQNNYPTKLKPPGEESSDDEVKILDPIPPKTNKKIVVEEQVARPKNPVEVIDLDDDDDDDDPKSSPEIVAVVLPLHNHPESSTSSSISEISTSNDNIQQQATTETIIEDTVCDSFCDKSPTLVVTQPDEIPAAISIDDNITQVKKENISTEKEQLTSSSSEEVIDNQINNNNNNNNNNKELPSTNNNSNDNQNEMIPLTQENNVSNIATPIDEHVTSNTEFSVSSEPSENQEQTSILIETPLTHGPVLCIKEEQENSLQISISQNIFEKEESDGEKSPSYNQENSDTGADNASNNNNNNSSVIFRALDSSNMNCATSEVPISYDDNNTNDDVTNNNTLMEGPEFFDEPPASPDQLEGNINEVETKVYEKDTDTSSCNDSSNTVCNTDHSITGHLPDTPLSPDQTILETNETEILVSHDKIVPTTNMNMNNNNNSNNLAANEEMEIVDTPLSPVQAMDIDIGNILPPLLIPIENSNTTTNLSNTNTLNFDSPASPEETMSIHISQESKQSVIVTTTSMNSDTIVSNPVIINDQEGKIIIINILKSIIPTENMDTTTSAAALNMDSSSSNVFAHDLSSHLLDQNTCKISHEPNMNSPSNNNINISPLVQIQTSPIHSIDKNIIDLNSSPKLLPINNNNYTHENAPDLTALIPPSILTTTHHPEINTSQNPNIMNNSNLGQPSDKILEDNLITSIFPKDGIDENKSSSSSITNTPESTPSVPVSCLTSFQTTNNTTSCEKDDNVTSLSLGTKSSSKKSAITFSSLPPLEKFAHNMVDVGFPSAEMEATQRFQRISYLIRSRKQQQQQK